MLLANRYRTGIDLQLKLSKYIKKEKEKRGRETLEKRLLIYHATICVYFNFLQLTGLKGLNNPPPPQAIPHFTTQTEILGSVSKM